MTSSSSEPESLSHSGFQQYALTQAGQAPAPRSQHAPNPPMNQMHQMNQGQHQPIQLVGNFSSAKPGGNAHAAVGTAPNGANSQSGNSQNPYAQNAYANQNYASAQLTDVPVPADQAPFTAGLTSDDIFIGRRNDYQNQLTAMNQARIQQRERQMLLNRMANEQDLEESRSKDKCCLFRKRVWIPLLLLILARAGVGIWFLVTGETKNRVQPRTKEEEERHERGRMNTT